MLPCLWRPERRILSAAFRLIAAQTSANKALSSGNATFTKGPVLAPWLEHVCRASAKSVRFRGRVGGCSLLVALCLAAAAGTAAAQAPLPDGLNPGASDAVSALAVQTDGKIVVGGAFTYLYPGNVSQVRNRIARLNADGSVDATFNSQANGTVYSLALQTDGYILVGGEFANLGGYTHYFIGRLHPNGAHDSGFNPTVLAPPQGYSVTARAQAVMVQPDGKIVVGGKHTVSGFPTTGQLSRVNTNGTTDTTFSTAGGVGASVIALALQPDGKIVVAGTFGTLRGQTRRRIGRVNSDGTLDTGFDLGVDPANASAIVMAMAVQPDGKILVAGQFNNVAGQPRTNLARLFPDGTLDPDFAPAVSGGGSPCVYSLALQADGKLLVGGYFSTVAGQPRANLARLGADGTLDSGFNPGANSYVYGLALQADGKVLAGGQFGILGGQGRRGIGRLNPTDPPTESLSDDGSTITWLRGGSGPEVWRTTFDVSTDLTNWTYLGVGTRFTDGWQLPGASLPPGGWIRARGFTAAGGFNASSWFAETTSGPCFFRSQPVGQTSNATSSVTFLAWAGGSPPLHYQWLKNKIPLQDGGQFSGAQTPALQLASVFGPDSASYSLIVSNDFGSLTSAVATLKVVDPFITSQPTALTNIAGTSASFAASGQGSTPLIYQWRKNGVAIEDGGNIAGAHTPTLTLTNVTGGNAGSYSLRVTNSFGTATSFAATLTVLDPLIVNQPVARLAVPGDTVSFSVTALGTPPLTYYWRRNGTNLLAPSAPSLILSNIAWSNEGTYDVLVSNAFASATSTGAVLSLNLATADSWVADAGGTEVHALAPQPDGGTLFAAAYSQRYSLARLNNDGSLDSGFDPQVNGSVYSVVVRADQRILAGGWFTMVGAGARSAIAQYNPDGSLDPFNPGANGDVNTFVVQPDGRVVVGGSFSLLGGYARSCLGRVYPNGTLDYSFLPEADAGVFALAVQSDGALLVGGSFSTLGGQSRKFLGRLKSDGTLDPGFVPPSAVDSAVIALAVQPDGKILLRRDGSSHYPLLRLNPNGSVDTAFVTFNNDYVNSMVLQADGKIVVGGNFTSLGGKTRNYIGRLNPDGSVDTQFNPGTSGVVDALAIQADGKILVGGAFGWLAGQPRGCLGRLNPTAPATQSLQLAGSTLTWLRGGSSPEVSLVSFDMSTDGTNWTALGNGSYVAGGWQLTGLTLPSMCTLRARGLVTGSRWNESSWWVQSALVVDPGMRPTIVTDDGSLCFRTNQFGFNVRAPVGRAIVIDASTNFLNWVALQTNLVVSACFSFSDPEARLLPRRFYRARVYDGALPPPGIRIGDGSAGFQQGRFGFNLTGVRGQTVVIDSSSNLLAWTAIATNTLVTELFSFTDPAPASSPGRFYRARLQ